MQISNILISLLYKTQGYDGHETHIITRQEKYKTRILFTITFIVSGFLGAMGVLLLYLPHQLFPEFFPWHEFSHPLVGTVKIKWAFSVYGLVLAFIEIGLLIGLNLISVSWLAKIYGFPEKEHPDKDLHVRTLWDMSFERKPKKILKMGIDPHQGMKKWTVITFVILLSLKASISNIFIKLLLERVLGRFFLVEYIDYIGMPVFAAWNIYGTYLVLRNAKLRIISTNIIDDFVASVVEKYHHSDVPKYIFKEVLQFLAISKRGFDHNHFYLTKKILENLELPPAKVYCDIHKLVHRIQDLSDAMKKDVVDILVLGMVIDGNLSAKEMSSLKLLKEHGVLPYDLAKIKNMAKSIYNGDAFSL